MITWENDISSGSDIGDTKLPVFEDDNVTPVKMRMKKSNGNIVSVDMLSKFTLDKIDADTLAGLIVGRGDISIQEQDGKLVVEYTGQPSDIYKCSVGDTVDIDKVQDAAICCLDKEGSTSYCVYADSSSIVFFGVTDNVPTLDKYDVATDTWTSKALVYVTMAELMSIVAALQENIDIVSRDITGLNDKITVETVNRVAGDKAARTMIAAGANVTVTSSTGSDGQDVYTVSASGGTGTSNILVVQYGDTVSLTELQKYDTVLMQMNDKTFYLTELSPSRAHFATSYSIDGKTATETCDYDGSSWSAISVEALDKVAVDSTSAGRYLDEVLVSDSDLVSLVKADGKLHVQVNTAASSDPKIQTLDEFAVNTSTSNYGAYALNTGYSKLVWQDRGSYSYMNAIVYQSMRIAASQGTITKCNVALTGNLTGDAPCFKIGLFSAVDGTLLGDTDLVFPTSGTMLPSLNMHPAFDDALNLKRNTRYIIQVWSCGCQLAAYSHGTTYNYIYDYTYRQNLQTTTSTADWVATSSTAFQRGEVVPYVSFGADRIY